MRNIPLNETFLELGGQFFRLVHIRNLGGPFSIGDSLPALLKIFVLVYFPLLLLVVVCAYYFWDNDLTTLQRWSLTGILGGGLGTLTDRIVRPDGVVDYLDFKFYGILGLDRWPVFNLADIAVILSTLFLLYGFLRQEMALDDVTLEP